MNHIYKNGLTRQKFERKIGEVIQELRLKKNLSPKQAAVLCGCSPDLWKRYETNGTPSIRVLLKIAVSLDDSLASLNKLIENKFPRQELLNFQLGVFQGGLKRNMDIREIEFYLKKEDRIWVKEKLQALAWLAEGMKVKDVKKRVGRTQATVQNWLGRYYKSGIGWVLKLKKGAPPPDPSEVWKNEKKENYTHDSLPR